MRFTLVLSVLAVALGRELDVSVNSSTGDFAVLVDGVEYLRSGPVSARHAGRDWSTADGSLALASLTPWEGRDAWGPFTEHALIYAAAEIGGWRFGANVRVHASSVTFEQFWVDGANDTALGDADGVMSSFPAFDVDDSTPLRGHCQWTSWCEA